eukprot:2483001-Amphidinium_carterae.2
MQKQTHSHELHCLIERKATCQECTTSWQCSRGLPARKPACKSTMIKLRGSFEDLHELAEI